MKLFTSFSVTVVVALVILFTLLGTLLWAPGDEEKPGRFVAVASGGGVTLGWSDDGASWTAGVDSDGNDPMSGGTGSVARQRNDIWVASGEPATGSSTKLWWSNNGKVWTDGTGDVFGTANGSATLDVEYFRNKWLAVGDPNVASSTIKKISYSTDGKSWTYVNGNPFGSNVESKCYWIKPGGNMVVAVGQGTDANIYYSYNGIDWTAASGSPFGDNISSVPTHVNYSPAGVWIAIGTNASTASEFLWRSTDGINWELPTTPPTTGGAGGNDVGYFNGVWVATTASSGSSTGGIWYSDDEGVNWTVATVDTDMSLIDVKDVIPPVRKDGKWVTGGEDTGGSTWITFTSTDGKTWTSNTTFDGTSSPATRYDSGVYGKAGGDDELGTRVVIGGVANSTEPLYYSDDAETWTAPVTDIFGASSTVHGVHWGFR